jgi:hypothetical protein
MVKIIGNQPKGKDMSAEDGVNVFKAAASQLTYRMGYNSPGLKKIAEKVKLPQAQLFTATLQEGSKMMDGFVKTAIKQFMLAMKADRVSLQDLFVLGFFIYSDGLGKAMMAGWEPPEGFAHEQVTLFKGALDSMMDNVRRQKEILTEKKEEEEPAPAAPILGPDGKLIN